MKKLSQFALLILLSITATANFTKPGQENGNAQIQNQHTIEANGFSSSLSFDGNTLLKLSLFNQNGAPIKFQLLQDGTSLMMAKYKAIAVSEGFNLGQLPAGVYTIRLVQGEQIIERNIIKKTPAIIFE